MLKSKAARPRGAGRNLPLGLREIVRDPPRRCHADEPQARPIKKREEIVERPSTAPMYAPDLEPLLQSLLKTVADIAFEHEREVERITASRLSETIKQERLRKLD